MLITDLINKKVNKEELNKEELAFLVDGFKSKKIADYQISSLLMTFQINGISAAEKVALKDITPVFEKMFAAGKEIAAIIDKKAAKGSLNHEELKFAVHGFIDGSVADFQMSSLLMAILINGMSESEMFDLTDIYVKTGETVDFGDLITVDKHSTGGVGDKVSIALGPVLKAMGIHTGKMSGRGLGFTGGTIDKLESIPGFNIELSKADFIKQVRDTKLAIIGQSDDIVPADKKIYALRDVTGTVNSMPLIAASIMSKKIATGAKVILLDVKCGSGAFMQNIEDARELARLMIKIGTNFGRKTEVEITSMEQPLGQHIGNAFETMEAVGLLHGAGPADLQEIVLSSAATIYRLHEAYRGVVVKDEDGLKKAYQTLADGTALVAFNEWIVAQGGDISTVLNGKYFEPKLYDEVLAEEDGFVNFVSCNQFGNIAILLGAGRKTKSDVLDYTSGLFLNKKIGWPVKKGEVLVKIYANKPIDKEVFTQLKANIKIEKTQPKALPLILEHVH